MAVSSRWRLDAIDNADDLVTEQRDRAVRIARERSLTCPDCGFSEPVPEDQTRTHLGGGAHQVLEPAEPLPMEEYLGVALSQQGAEAHLGLFCIFGTTSGAAPS